MYYSSDESCEEDNVLYVDHTTNTTSNPSFRTTNNYNKMSTSLTDSDDDYDGTDFSNNEVFTCADETFQNRQIYDSTPHSITNNRSLYSNDVSDLLDDDEEVETHEEYVLRLHYEFLEKNIGPYVDKYVNGDVETNAAQYVSSKSQPSSVFSMTQETRQIITQKAFQKVDDSYMFAGSKELNEHKRKMRWSSACWIALVGINKVMRMVLMSNCRLQKICQNNTMITGYSVVVDGTMEVEKVIRFVPNMCSGISMFKVNLDDTKKSNIEMNNMFLEVLDKAKTTKQIIDLSEMSPVEREMYIRDNGVVLRANESQNSFISSTKGNQRAREGDAGVPIFDINSGISLQLYRNPTTKENEYYILVITPDPFSTKTMFESYMKENSTDETVHEFMTNKKQDRTLIQGDNLRKIILYRIAKLINPDMQAYKQRVQKLSYNGRIYLGLVPHVNVNMNIFTPFDPKMDCPASWESSTKYIFFNNCLSVPDAIGAIPYLNGRTAGVSLIVSNKTKDDELRTYQYYKDKQKTLGGKGLYNHLTYGAFPVGATNMVGIEKTKLDYTMTSRERQWVRDFMVKNENIMEYKLCGGAYVSFILQNAMANECRNILSHYLPNSMNYRQITMETCAIMCTQDSFTYASPDELLRYCTHNGWVSVLVDNYDVFKSIIDRISQMVLESPRYPLDMKRRPMPFLTQIIKQESVDRVEVNEKWFRYVFGKEPMPDECIM